MTTIRELTERYIFENDLRESSAKTYRACCRAFVRRFGNISVDHTARDEVIKWRRDFLAMDRSRRSWNTYSSHLRTIFKFGIEQNLLIASANPFSNTRVTPPRKKKKTVVHHAITAARDWLEAQESEELTKGRRARVTPAWFWIGVYDTFYYTGIRLNALISMRMEDVDLFENTLLIRGETEKTHRDFRLPIPAPLLPAIVRLVHSAQECEFKPGDQLFNVNRFSIHYSRETMDTNQVSAMYKKLTQQIGVRMSPHRFRHTLASDLMKTPDRDIHTTMHLMNHSNIATTMEYIEEDLDGMQAAMEKRALLAHRGRRVARIERLPQTERLLTDGTSPLDSKKAKSDGSTQILLPQGSAVSGRPAFEFTNQPLRQLSHSSTSPTAEARARRWQELISTIDPTLDDEETLRQLMNLTSEDQLFENEASSFGANIAEAARTVYRRRT